METQSTSSGLALAIARHAAMEASGSAPIRYCRETLTSSTAATSWPSLTIAAAASPRIPPIPRIIMRGAEAPVPVALLFLHHVDGDLRRHVPMQPDGDFVLAQLLDRLIELDL